MRGVVEIWDGDELVLEEPNMLVDGAGELLADIMTVSPSLSAVEDHATSSILDASNYRIQAISFGTGSYYFNNGAREVNSDKLSVLDFYLGFFEAGNPNSVGVVPLVRIPKSRADFGFYDPNFTTSLSGVPIPELAEPTMDQLPTAPNPSLKTLEINTNTSALVPLGEAEDGTLSLSSVFPGNGQHCNFLPSAILSAAMESTPFSGTAKAYYTAASLLGSFPEGSGAPYGYPFDQLRVFYTTDNQAQARSQTMINGVFNEASSMDISGFVTNIMDSVPANTYQMSSTFSGLCLSATNTDKTKLTNYEGYPFVEYSVLLGAGDLGHVNAYGGIYHIGLWSIDMKQSLLNGNSPPFAFSVLNNPRKYKLFCRKGLSKNLCHISDDAKYKNLTLKWRIHFR